MLNEAYFAWLLYNCEQLIASGRQMYLRPLLLIEVILIIISEVQTDFHLY